MTDVTTGPGPTAESASGWWGQPRGLSTLFFTELWERFSYYGMRAILVLFMTNAVSGLAMSDATATAIYGLYTAGVYLLALPGGWVADRILGQRRAVFVGGVIIAAGHFTLAVPSLATFYGGLTLIVLGTGLLKPNISAIVGDLYPGGRRAPRRGILHLLHGDQHRRARRARSCAAISARRSTGTSGSARRAWAW